MKLVLTVLLFSSFVQIFAADKIKVITTTPDLAWAAGEIGKEWVEVRSLLKGTENPHFVDAIPEFIRVVAEANVVCSVGLDLEVGWLPKVLSRSGNADVQPGGKGFCETGKRVTSLEKPTGNVDRSMGDIHPFGNPHFWLSPTAFKEATLEIQETLARVDPAHSRDFQKNRDVLSKKLDTIRNENLAKVKVAIAGLTTPVMEYHREFTYFFSDYGISSFGAIEEKPGIPPSAGRLAEIGTAAKKAGVKLAFAGSYAPHKTMERFREISGIEIALVPTSIQLNGNVKDYSALQNQIVSQLIQALSRKNE